MTLYSAISTVLLALAAPALATIGPLRAPPPAPTVAVTQLSIHEHIVIRIPRMPGSRAAKADQASPIAWKEKRGPKCIAASDLGGALISGPSAVDLVLAGGQRVRAKLDDDCQPLDFYGGFYIRPGADGQVCASRDSIRIRSGGSCRIDNFRRLVAKR